MNGAWGALYKVGTNKLICSCGTLTNLLITETTVFSGTWVPNCRSHKGRRQLHHGCWQGWRPEPTGLQWPGGPAVWPVRQPTASTPAEADSCDLEAGLIPLHQSPQQQQQRLVCQHRASAKDYEWVRSDWGQVNIECNLLIRISFWYSTGFISRSFIFCKTNSCL